MANQPKKRQPFRFWYWGTPTPTARPPAPSRRPAARAPPRTPSPPAAAPSPSRRPSKQSPRTLRSPSPTQEESQPQKEAATQEVSPAPSLSTPTVSQPESPTKKPVEPKAQDTRLTVEVLSQTTEQPQPQFPTGPEPQEQSLSEPASQPPGAGSQTTQVSEPETVHVDTVLGTIPTQDLISEGEPKEIKVEKPVASKEESKKEQPPVEGKPQVDMESKQDSESSQLPPVGEKPQIDTESKQDSEPSQLPPVEEKPQIDTESKQDSEPSQLPTVEEKPQIDPKSKQDSKLIEVTSQIPQGEEKSTIKPELKEETQPSHIPQEAEKPKEIIEEKPKIELEVIGKTQPEESIKPELKEETQPSHIPQEDQKPEEIIEEKPSIELEVIGKTEPEESKKETQPSQIPQQEEKPEEIIKEKPTTELEVIKTTEPGSPKSETAPQEKKNDEPKTKPEAKPVKKSTLSSDESKDTTEIQLSTAEPDSEAPGPHPDTSELMTKLRSSMEQTNQDDSEGRESTTRTRRIPWASPSHEERASFHKEINKGISKLVQKLKLGQLQQLGSESTVSIITLAGDNNGATMFLGHETTKKESVLHINKKAEASSGSKEIQKQMLNHTDSENSAITASINSNVQSINNSLLHESSGSEEDPGVHLVLSIKPNKPAKSKERAESIAASTAPA